MTITHVTKTKIFFSQSDIMKLIEKELNANDFTMHGDPDIIYQSKDRVPKGATAGDELGIEVEAVGLVNDKDFEIHSITLNNGLTKH